MTTYTAYFLRYNPQLPNGGYETTRTIEAKSITQARKKAREIENRVIYGGMSLRKIEKEA